jgi:hypothetical protein
MRIRSVVVMVAGLVVGASLLCSQTVADAARQNRADKKAKRVFTSEDMAPAKPEVASAPAVPDSKSPVSSSKKKKKEQADAEAAAAAARAAEAEALAQEKAKFEQIVSQLTEAEREVSQLRQRQAETVLDANATPEDKNRAKEAVEAADAKRKELNAAFLAQRKKAGADPMATATPAGPQAENPK